MKVSIVIPALNEAGCIAQTLSEIPVNTYHEIIVVDGNSPDGTADIVRQLGYKVIIQKTKGFGGGFAEGIDAATGDIVILMNADGSMNSGDIPKMIDRVNEGYDCVFAVRYAHGYGSEDDDLVHHIGNMFFTFLVNLIHKVFIWDALYFFVAFRRDKASLINPKSLGFSYCVEFPIKAHKAGLKISQVPSKERPRRAGESKVNAFIDGLKILKMILFCR
jgi:glycosyltransferase involved in cell wall biosynthesis